MFQRPRGTRDFGPDEMGRRVALEKLCDEQAARHGFLRVATPTFESLDLFTAKSGDAVVDELYAFEDKGGRPLALRPELAAPVMRMVANEMRSVPKPMRLAYFGSCFRYEEFKAARYREFWQYGCEIVGASGPLVEAEVVAFAISLMRAAGVEDWTMKIGHVGILNDLLAGLSIPEDSRRDVMRILDKGDFASLAGKGVGADAAAKLEAFASLSKDMKKSIEGLKAKHVFNYNKTTREEMRLDDDDVAFAIHPLVKQHPTSGQKSIYLSRLMTREIVGLEPDESENL